MIEGVGLIVGQFFPPSPDNLIGGKKFPIQRYYQKLYAEEQGGSTNNDEVDLQYCKKILESNRFKGLVPMIATMDLELYYRLTQMKTRTSRSVLRILEKTEVNYKIHEAGVLDSLRKNLKKWSDLLGVSKNNIFTRSDGEAVMLTQCDICHKDSSRDYQNIMKSLTRVN